MLCPAKYISTHPPPRSSRVRREHCRSHTAGMALKCTQALAGSPAPEFRRAIRGSCEHLLTIWREHCRGHTFGMALKSTQALARSPAPELRREILGSREHLLTV